MSLSSAAFFCENLAGTVSVSAGAPGTAKAPSTNTLSSNGLALGACALGSSLPVLPGGVCCAFSCCDCCCASGCGDGCWAAATATPPSNANTIALVRSRRLCMAVSFMKPTPPSPPAYFALLRDFGHDDAVGRIDQQQAIV